MLIAVLRMIVLAQYRAHLIGGMVDIGLIFVSPRSLRKEIIISLVCNSKKGNKG